MQQNMGTSRNCSGCGKNIANKDGNTLLFGSVYFCNSCANGVFANMRVHSVSALSTFDKKKALAKRINPMNCLVAPYQRFRWDFFVALCAFYVGYEYANKVKQEDIGNLKIFTNGSELFLWLTIGGGAQLVLEMVLHEEEWLNFKDIAKVKNAENYIRAGWLPFFILYPECTKTKLDTQ